MLAAHYSVELTLRTTPSDSDLYGANAVAPCLDRSGDLRDSREGSVWAWRFSTDGVSWESSLRGLPKARYFGNPTKFLWMWRSGGTPRRSAQTRSVVQATRLLNFAVSWVPQAPFFRARGSGFPPTVCVEGPGQSLRLRTSPRPTLEICVRSMTRGRPSRLSPINWGPTQLFHPHIPPLCRCTDTRIFL